MKVLNQSIEAVPIADLKLHPRNANRGDADAIRESIDANGFWGTIVVQRSTGYVLAGNHRLEAAKESGAAEVPVAWVDVDDEAALRILLADNRTTRLGSDDPEALVELLQELADSDAGLVGTGFGAEDLDALLAEVAGPVEPGDDPGAQVDRAEELREKWGTERGQIWRIGAHRLMVGDSSDGGDVATLLGKEKLAMIFTSPPYAVGLDYASYEDTIQNLRLLLVALANLWGDHTRGGGYCVTNFGDIIPARAMLGTDEVCEYPVALEYWPVFRDAGWLLHSRRIWAKPHARVAAPWCASSNRAASDWEHLWTWKKPGVGLNERREPSYLGVWDTSKGENVGIGKEDHPAGFPALLPRWAISVYTNRGQSVGEPFCGTGTTMVACEQEGRACYAMEIDPGYAAMTIERLAGMGLEPHRVTRDEE